MFLGGDQNIEELFDLCKAVKDIGLKTCIYSGEESTDIFSNLINHNLLDYLKIGKYKKEFGALNIPGTNQVMYKIENKSFTDITYRFQEYLKG